MLRILPVGISLCLLVAPSFGQEASSGIGVPVTVSGDALYSGRLQLQDPAQSPLTGGARAMLYPTLQLGSHWFGYAAVQVRYAPNFYYDAYHPEHEVYTEVLQAFGGYSLRANETTVIVKAGRLVSAFGSFPLRYDDAENPLLDQPLSYIQTLTLRADQLPCGTKDLTRQHYGSVSNQCGGEPNRASGLTPVNLYGLPAAQIDISGHRLDARLQVASGSPSYPQELNEFGRYHQWSAGAGYTIRQGFRVGISGFRGPYLEQSIASALPEGANVRSFPASGIGVDVQWARGRWSVNGEWQKFRFVSPNFAVSPSVQSSYLEVKTRLTPRLFVSGRPAWLIPGGVVDKAGVSTARYAPAISSYELGAGWWLNRHQLLKASYEWLNIEHRTGTQLNVAGVQFVTTFNRLNWAFR